MTWSDDETNIETQKTVPQDYDYELLNPQSNQNSHHNNKGTDSVKSISEDHKTKAFVNTLSIINTFINAVN